MKLARYILPIIILLLSACTSHVDEQLKSVEDYYVQNKVINDSVNNVLSQIKTEKGTNEDMMKRILHAIYLFDKNDTEKSFSEFESCTREMDDGITPYWHCVVEDYIAIIYLNTGLEKKSRSHFYKVLDYAKMMKDEKAIANANSHISLYYHMVGELDSALYFASKVLTNENVLDSQMVAIAYHNLALVQTSIAQSSNTNVLNTLKLSQQYNIGTADSMVTYALMSQAYYLRDSHDTAYSYQHKVESANHNNAKLILYKFLTDYYAQQSETDSAYKYLKLYNHMDSICLRGKLVEPILTTAYEYDKEITARSFMKQRTILLVACAFAILIIIIGMWWHYQRKLAKVYREIEQQRPATGVDTHRGREQEENAYRNSEVCQRFKKRAVANESIKLKEWSEIESCVKTISPDFYSKFYSLHKASLLEYRTCLLIRARFTPSEIAVLLCKSQSGISSIRSRLYQKVFGKKGSPSDWDEFIISL